MDAQPLSSSLMATCILLLPPRTQFLPRATPVSDSRTSRTLCCQYSSCRCYLQVLNVTLPTITINTHVLKGRQRDGQAFPLFITQLLPRVLPPCLPTASLRPRRLDLVRRISQSMAATIHHLKMAMHQGVRAISQAIRKTHTRPAPREVTVCNQSPKLT